MTADELEKATNIIAAAIDAAGYRLVFEPTNATPTLRERAAVAVLARLADTIPVEWPADRQVGHIARRAALAVRYADALEAALEAKRG